MSTDEYGSTGAGSQGNPRRPHPHPNGHRAGLTEIGQVAKWARPLLTGREFQLWCVIRDFERENGRGCTLSVSKMAEVWDQVSERQIKSHLQALTEKGFLVTVRRSRTSARRWAVTPEDWSQRVGAQRERMGWGPTGGNASRRSDPSTSNGNREKSQHEEMPHGRHEEMPHPRRGVTEKGNSSEKTSSKNVLSDSSASGSAAPGTTDPDSGEETGTASGDAPSREATVPDEVETNVPPAPEPVDSNEEPPRGPIPIDDEDEGSSSDESSWEEREEERRRALPQLRRNRLGGGPLVEPPAREGSHTPTCFGRFGLEERPCDDCAVAAECQMASLDLMGKEMETLGFTAWEDGRGRVERVAAVGGASG